MPDSGEDKSNEFRWRLKKFQEQYELYAQEKEISQPNNEASRKINKILFEKEAIDKNDLQEIRRLIDWTEGQPHWSGASWMDYKMHVRTYLGFKGFEIDLPGV